MHILFRLTLLTHLSLFVLNLFLHIVWARRAPIASAVLLLMVVSAHIHATQLQPEPQLPSASAFTTPLPFTPAQASVERAFLLQLLSVNPTYRDVLINTAALSTYLALPGEELYLQTAETLDPNHPFFQQ